MTKTLRQFGLTPGKAALVAVLAIGLGAVWVPQLVGALGGGAEPASPKVAKSRRPVTRPAARSARTAPTESAAPAGESEKPVREKPRSAIGLTHAVSHDPFAPPAWSPKSKQVAVVSERGGANQTVLPSDLEQRFASVRESGVAMIVVSESGRAVQIGEHMLKVGDQLEGFEVVEITDRGVVFRPARDTGDGRGA